MPDTQERARHWSYRRQLLGQRAPDDRSALRAVVGVYSAHPSAPLSLHARCVTLDPASFRRLDAGRLALRLPAMRGSIHLLPRETAHLAFGALREPPARAASRLRYFGISGERYAGLRTAVLAAAKEPRTARELRDATGAGEELRGVLGAMTREGALLRVGAEGLRSNVLRYATTEAWLGGPLPKADPEEALAWLAGEYLRAFGPARVEDFRWWTGVSRERASAALERVETVALDDGYLLPSADLRDFEATTAVARGTVDLLPKWDCYTMGYAPDGRHRLVHPDVQDRLYDLRGDGRGAVLVDGEAVGAWELRFSGKRMHVRLDRFERPSPALERAIAERFGEIATLLGARDLSLETPQT